MKMLLVLLSVLIPLPISACSCSELTVQEVFQSVDVVFSGKIVKSQTVQLTGRFRGESITLHTINVANVWKGDVPATIIFYRYSTEDSCRIDPFRNGDEWLVYAHKKNRWLIDEIWKQLRSQGIKKPSFVYLTSLCLKTRELSSAQEDIKELGRAMQFQ